MMEMETLALIRKPDGRLVATHLPEFTEAHPGVLTGKLSGECSIVVAFRFDNGHANYRVVGWDDETECFILELAYGELAEVK